jgi:polyisoprenoid-binding protein YceI
MRVISIALGFWAAFGCTLVSAEEIYKLDPKHTQVAFSVDRFGYNRVMGRFDIVSGDVILDQDRPERSRVHAILDTVSLSTGDSTRDDHVRGPSWLRAAEFPKIEFRSTSVKLLGPKRAEVAGDLVMLGVTASVTIDVTLNRVGSDPATKQNTAGFSATGTLLRSSFGSKTAPQLIGDEVRITIEALGHRSPAVTP